MQRNTSITLGARPDKFVSQPVENGRYGSASETVRAGLRLLEKEETKPEVLRNALIEGENSGRANYSLNELIAELDAEKNPLIVV